MKQRIQIAFLLSALLALSQLTEAKRTLSGGSRKSSSSGSYNSRRTSSSSSGSSVTRPAHQQPSNSHADVAKLSYPNYNSQPNRPATGGAASSNTNNNAPIGWNVPNTNAAAKPPSYNQANPGPPPAYSPQNVPGGAHSNMHEPPPVYKPPVQGAPPSYPGNQPAVAASYPKQQSYPQQSAGVGAGVAAGSYPQNTGLNTPIKAQTVRPVMSSYPHGTGAQPGASYPVQPQAAYPQQSYHPQSYPQQHGFPAGGGGYANYPPPQGPPVFAGSGVQPGYYPAGSFPMQQQKSSGPGLGTGLIAGALGGAILGHALTPTHTQTVQQAAAPVGSSDGNHDRVIIINNTPGQPSTVVTNGDPAQMAGQQGAITPVGAGMVNSQPPQMGQQYPPQQQPPQGYNQPGQVAPMPGAVPVNPPVQGGPYAEGTVPLAPFPDGNNNNLAAMPPNNMTNPDQAQQQQPTYGVMCVPVLKNVTHPENPANVTQVEEVQCFNVEQPPPGAPGAGMPPAPPVQPGMMDQQQPGMPPLANAPQQQQVGQQQQQPGNDMNNFPQQKGSTASWAENNKVTVNAGAFKINSGSLGIFASSVVALLATYCLH